MSAPTLQGQPRLTSYTVSNTVRVDVRTLEDVGRLIDAALSRGVNEMSGLQFYSSKAEFRAAGGPCHGRCQCSS